MYVSPDKSLLSVITAESLELTYPDNSEIWWAIFRCILETERFEMSWQW